MISFPSFRQGIAAFREPSFGEVSFREVSFREVSFRELSGFFGAAIQSCP